MANTYEASGDFNGDDKKDHIPADIKTITPLDIDVGDGIVTDITEEYSEAYYRKLRWKIDLWLLPLMWVCYGTQQADKTGISTMAVFGLREDTGLVGQQFNWLSTIFYLSYMVCEFPGNYLMQKFHVGRFLGIVIVCWGIVVLCIAFAQNWAGLMVLRTLQGGLECTISPTFMLITGAFYTSKEHTLRALIWGTSNAGMNIITGLCMYGIGSHAKQVPGSMAAVSWCDADVKEGLLTFG
jgi:ACS family allantoate permease-like MFS transporter